jgi:hypothetical protein
VAYPNEHSRMQSQEACASALQAPPILNQMLHLRDEPRRSPLPLRGYRTRKSSGEPAGKPWVMENESI